MKSLLSPTDEAPFVSDHSGYGPGGESFEHDDTGSTNNFSGCVDDMVNAQIDHEGWQEGYDY